MCLVGREDVACGRTQTVGGRYRTRFLHFDTFTLRVQHTSHRTHGTAKKYFTGGWVVMQGLAKLNKWRNVKISTV